MHCSSCRKAYRRQTAVLVGGHGARAVQRCIRDLLVQLRAGPGVACLPKLCLEPMLFSGHCPIIWPICAKPMLCQRCMGLGSPQAGCPGGALSA